MKTDALDRLTDAMVEDILPMSGKEVIAEMREDGMSEEDIKNVADKLRLRFEKAKAEVRTGARGGERLMR